MSDAPDLTIYAWVGEDANGDMGICSILTGLGPSAAVFGKRELAEKFTDQIQQRANMVDQPVYLMEFRTIDAPPLTTITPKES